MGASLKRGLYLFVAALVLAPMVAGAPVLAQRAGGPSLTAPTPSPLLDGMTPVFWLSGSDPTVAPGLDLPIGSIARVPSASGNPVYYFKRGPNSPVFSGNPQDWEIIGSARVATWPISVVRYFLVDGTSGSDRNPCYIDATAGATLTPTGKACKTIAHLLEVLPRYGNGRAAVVLIKTGTYAEFLDYSGVSGYRYFLTRGSTDLTNSTADRITLGAQIAVSGPGAGGRYTLTGVPTSSIWTIAAGSLGAADTAVGYRWRFDAATTTAALRNVACFMSINSTTVATCGIDLGATPVSGDTGYLEKPGVVIAAYREADGRAGGYMSSAGTALLTNAYALAGIAVSGTGSSTFQVGSAGGASYSFVHAAGSTTNAVLVSTGPAASASFSINYFDEAGTVRVAGAGLRSDGGVSVVGHDQIWGSVAFQHATANTTIIGNTLNVGGGGSYWAKGPTIIARAGTNSTTNGSGNLFGTTSATHRATRVIPGPLNISGAFTLQSVTVNNSASEGIKIAQANGAGSRSYSFRTVTGSGNATHGIDLSNLNGANVEIAGSTNITGSSGDVILPNSVTLAIADLSLTNVVDLSGNQIQGSAGYVVGQATLVVNKHGSALAVGNVVRDNGATAQVVKAQADTAAHATGPLCVMVTAPANNANGLAVCSGGVPYVLFDGGPTMSALSYLSPGTAGVLTSTVPALAGTNQKRRCSHPLKTSGNAGYVPLHCELIPVAADGAL